MRIAQKLSVAFLALSLTFSGAAMANDGSEKPKDGWNHKSHSEMMRHHPRLSEEKLKLLKHTMRQAHEENKELFEKARDLDKAMREALATEPFDEGAYLDLSDQIEDIHAKIKRANAEAFASIASQFTVQERKMLAHHIGRHHHWHHHKGTFRHHGHNKHDKAPVAGKQQNQPVKQ
jgi:uncharacterized membrane protein